MTRLFLDTPSADFEPEGGYAGARVVAEHPDWTVMADPAGHRYCLCSC
ncbi:MAG TPA: VOC family protein [Trebonia sp.]|nr:VOC family protein [Trebonia sp.]